EKVKGTYSVLAAVNNVGLVAFRDGQGRRPLYYGVQYNKKQEIVRYAFASETVALEKMLYKGTSTTFRLPNGQQGYDEVPPGAMMFISKDFEVYQKQIIEPMPLLCPFEAVYFERASSFFYGQRVREIRKKLIHQLWERFAQSQNYTAIAQEPLENKIIVAIPNTASSPALYLSQQTGIPYDMSMEKTQGSGRIFMKPGQRHREHNTIIHHYLFEEDVKGKHVIMVDDSIVRGTTSKQDIKYLKDAGAKSIHVFILFPEIRHPCMHAIDFHTYEELFTYNKTEQQMKTSLGLRDSDSLYFSTHEDLKKAIGTNNLCNECYQP
ncbi:MAG: phosphoribosyltransferase family protein, partial [Candidatus Woesearchaeota archaeon]